MQWAHKTQAVLSSSPQYPSTGCNDWSLWDLEQVWDRSLLYHWSTRARQKDQAWKEFLDISEGIALPRCSWHTVATASHERVRMDPVMWAFHLLLPAETLVASAVFPPEGAVHLINQGESFFKAESCSCMNHNANTMTQNLWDLPLILSVILWGSTSVQLITLWNKFWLVICRSNFQDCPWVPN